MSEITWDKLDTCMECYDSAPPMVHVWEAGNPWESGGCLCLKCLRGLVDDIEEAKRLAGEND